MHGLNGTGNHHHAHIVGLIRRMHGHGVALLGLVDSLKRWRLLIFKKNSPH